MKTLNFFNISKAQSKCALANYKLEPNSNGSNNNLESSDINKCSNLIKIAKSEIQDLKTLFEANSIKQFCH